MLATRADLRRRLMVLLGTSDTDDALLEAGGMNALHAHLQAGLWETWRLLRAKGATSLSATAPDLPENDTDAVASIPEPLRELIVAEAACNALADGWVARDEEGEDDVRKHRSEWRGRAEAWAPLYGVMP